MHGLQKSVKPPRNKGDRKMKKTNKTTSLSNYLHKVAKTIDHPGGPDCSNRHPGTCWAWSPSQTATKAAPDNWIHPCWHGSAPTPGTQMVAGLATEAAAWLQAWDEIPRDGGIHEIDGRDWQFVDGELRRA